jgi:hypothetical protein
VDDSAGCASDEFREFASALGERLSRPHLAEATPATTLAQLGLDSLGMLELLVALDELGVLRAEQLTDPFWPDTNIGHLPLGELFGKFVAKNASGTPGREVEGL